MSRDTAHQLAEEYARKTPAERLEERSVDEAEERVASLRSPADRAAYEDALSKRTVVILMLVECAIKEARVWLQSAERSDYKFAAAKYLVGQAIGLTNELAYDYGDYAEPLATGTIYASNKAPLMAKPTPRSKRALPAYLS
jgi:hypothetical protein